MATVENDFSERPVQITERTVVLTTLVLNGPTVSTQDLHERAQRASQLGRVNGFNFGRLNALGVNTTLAALTPHYVKQNSDGTVVLLPHAYDEVSKYLDNQLSPEGQREISLLTTPLPSHNPKAVSLLDGDYFPRPFEEVQ